MAAGAAGYVWWLGDHVAATALAAITIMGFGGYRVGATRIAGFLIGLATAVVYAPGFGGALEANFAEWFGMTGLANRIASVGAVGIGITLAAMIVAAILSRFLFGKRPLLRAGDRWIGFGVGTLQGAIVMLLLLGGMLEVEAMAKQRVESRIADDELRHAVAVQVVKVAEKTRESRIASLVSTYNPFDRVPQLRSLRRRVQVISDPAKLNDLVQHPSMERFTERPQVRKAIDNLTADPQLQQALQSGQPIDQKTALSLMNNPSVLKLLDEPEFMSEMSRLLSELDPELVGAE
jgi:uncharacterized membrane protein required for colicin V production